MEIPASTSRKRKCVEPQNVDLNSFSIQSHLSSPFDPAVRITPTVVLPHNHVPLHWIAGVPSRFFDRSVEFTELVRPGDVAIVKIEGERQLSAIESLEDGVYALYRLSTQVKLKEVRKLNAQITRSRKDKECKTLDHTQQSADDPWWCSSGTHRYPFSDHENNGLIGTTSLDWGGGVVSYRLSTGDAALHGQHSLTARPSSFEVLDHLRHQYYQTLYLSKTSLAYFSKSALSRARTMFQGEQPCPPLNGLVDFLKTMIVPLQEMDTKYLKSLVHFASEETIDDNSVFRTHEDAYIPRWRSLAFGDRFIQENDTHLKEVLAALRTRETELQVILLLEILALNKNTSHETQEVSITKTKRKPSVKYRGKGGILDPEILLELLVDRLCIWHSIGSETSDQKQGSSSRMNGASEKDHLRHFSVEVLMPFYASKLPEKCASINKKFGGHVSGSKRARDPYRSKAVGGKRAPKLKRSATAPEPTKVCGGENSENLSAIAAESITLNTSRGGTLNSKNFSKRVIQLDIKSDQKKSQEDLRDAIKAVIKPNRIAVATELADSAEQRQASGSRRKSKKTMRPPLNTILVTATPKKRKEVLGPRYAERRTVSPLSHDTSTIQSDLSISAGGENSHFRTPVKLCRSLTSNDGMFNSNLERNIIDSPAGGVKLVMATPLKKQIKHPEDQGTIDDIYGALGWGFSDS